MKTKTIHLLADDGYDIAMTDDVVVHLQEAHDDHMKLEWVPTRYRLGAECWLVSCDDDSYRLSFVHHDVQDVKRFHGFRRITKIRFLKTGDIAVTVGADLTPELDEFD